MFVTFTCMKQLLCEVRVWRDGVLVGSFNSSNKCQNYNHNYEVANIFIY